MKSLLPLLLPLLLGLSAAAQTRTKAGTLVTPREGSVEAKASPKSFTFSQQAPIYLVLAPTRLSPVLEPLVEWKRQCGFEVRELPADSHQRDTLRAQLHRYCDTLSASFLLLVGDAIDLPQFIGTHTPEGLGATTTDIPYADLDSDGRADMLLGRLPTSDTALLRALVEKTIVHEAGRLHDESHLSRALLLAGNESREPAPLLTNAQVAQTAQLFAAQAYDTLTRYNPAYAAPPDGWEEEARGEVLRLLADGAAWVNYSGHALFTGWRHPSVSAYDVDSLPEEGRWGIFVNNCCSANSLSQYAFSVALMGKRQGGAVAMVGASNETLWDEDYWWACGNDTVEGLFSRLSSGEVWLAGQMVEAGHQAVERIGSPYSQWYREMYSLFGDPSMMISLGTPDPLTLSALNDVDTATLSLEVEGTPGAYVALAERGELLAVALLDSAGLGTLFLPHPPSQPYLTITAQKSGHQTLQDTLPVHGYRPLNTQFPTLTTLSVYPNPCGDYVVIEGVKEQGIGFREQGIGNREEGTVYIELLDMHGRLVLREPYTLNPIPYSLNPIPYSLSPIPYTLNLKGLPGGLYLLRVGEHSIKLVIKR